MACVAIQSCELQIQAQKALWEDTSSQLNKVRDVLDLTWGYGYKEGLERLKDHLVHNPSVNLRALDLASLEPNP